MNNSAKKVLALAMAASMMLSACGSTQAPAETPAAPSTPEASTTTPAAPEKTEIEPIEDLVMYQTAANETDTFNMLHSQSQPSSDVICNLVDGLLEVDPSGKLIPCIAKEWGTEDGIVWTFKLREGVKWVDMNANEKKETTSADFATGLEWVLNYHKNESYNTSMPLEMIKGAQEYYDYTKELSAEEAYALTAGEGSKFLETVGMDVSDPYTIVYTCVSEKPYFDSLGAYACMYPLAQELVDELGVDGVKAMNNTNMWYNGAYLMDSFISGNEKHYVQNPTYWDTESTRFNTVTVKMIESIEVGYQLYQNGEIDYIQLSEANLSTILSNPNHEFYNYLVENKPTKYSWQLYWNYNKLDENGNPDENYNKAVANKNFRKSVFHGWDNVEWLKRHNTVNPLKCENNFYTMKGLCYTTDGRDYVDLVQEELGLESVYNGETLIHYNAELAADYKAKAMEELTAAGVTFPVQLDYYISGSNQTALDSATVLKNSLENSLGSDYVTLNIKTYVSSFAKEVRDASLHGLYISGWGADYGDPMNYLSQELMGYDGAWYADRHRNINKVTPADWNEELLTDMQTFTDMVYEADKITNIDERYAAFAKAEAFLIDNALAHPLYYDIKWTLTKINPYSKPNALFGVCNNKYKNWETNKDGYTTAQMDEILANAQ